MRKILVTVVLTAMLLCLTTAAASTALAQVGTPVASPTVIASPVVTDVVSPTVIVSPTATVVASPTVLPSPNVTAVPGLSNIVDTANGMGNLKTFTSLANKAGLTDTLSRGGPYTVLAPSDDAFNRMPAGALNALSNDTPRLKSVMANHVIQGRYTANQLLDAKKVTNLNNKTLVIVPRQGLVKVGSGHLIKEDIPASNGIIHVVDTVAIPA